MTVSVFSYVVLFHRPATQLLRLSRQERLLSCVLNIARCLGRRQSSLIKAVTIDFEARFGSDLMLASDLICRHAVQDRTALQLHFSRH